MHTSAVGSHLLLLGALALLPGSAAQARSWGDVEFVPCTLAPAFSPLSAEAQCATVAVPENHDDASSRQIELAVAWVPASGNAEADPVVLLAGGPGQSARDSYPTLAGAFRDLRRTRHVLLIDQRGTGNSNPLLCEIADDGPFSLTEQREDSVQASRELAEECRQQLGAHADLARYSTSDAVRDIEYVRELLGAPSLNLLGISYGSRVAQQYALRWPEHTRSLILDGVVPNDLVLGAEHASNLESALEQQFAACASSAACSDKLGNPREQLQRLLQQIDARLETKYSYRDPRSAELLSEPLTRNHLTTVVRMYAYSPLTAALLPLSLHEAANGRPEALMAQARMLGSSLGDQIAIGMQLSVMCAEDALELRVNPADERTVLGNELIEVLLAQCAVWPQGERPANFREALRGDIPTLLLSGEFDPVTPPRYGDAVANTLDKARHLVLAGQGHNVLPVGCTPKLAARFVDTLDPMELDASCLDGLNPVPPFIDFYGWEP